MTDFKNRKFLLLLMLGAAVFFLRVFLPLDAWLIAAVSAAIAVLFFVLGGGFAKRAASIIFALFVFGFTALPLLYGAHVASRGEAALAYAERGEAKAAAIVTEVRFRSAYASSYLVDVTEVGGEKADFRALLEIEDGTFFEYGDIIEFTAVFEGTEKEEEYLRAENIFLRATAEDAARKGRTETGLLHKLEVKFDGECEKKLPKDKLNGVISLLSEDPRPAYIDDPDRIYTMTFGDHEISFSVADNTLTVKCITKNSN
jgi:hypothetical protein